MKTRRRIEKFLRRIDVIADPERKRLRLEELLEVRDKAKKSTSGDTTPTVRRLMTSRKMWKVAAVIGFAATAVGVIGILQNGDQTAYAFEQTVAAMQGKRSFHIRTYHGSPTKIKDEYWAEFDKNGQVTRLRQVEWLGREVAEVEVIWKNKIKYQYELDDKRGRPGILLISNKDHHVDEEDLEEFDPERLMEQMNDMIEEDELTVTVSDSQTQYGHIVVEVADDDRRWRRVLLVNSATNLVLRMDMYTPYNPDDDNEEDESYVEGNARYSSGIEVLEYNQPLDPELFEPNFPKDTIIIDQLSREVGMAQGDLSDKEVASQLMHRTLEAWAADDYDTAGLLFGGAPPEFFVHRASEKPIGEIVVGQPEWMPLEPNRPRFGLKCKYVAERTGRRATIHVVYCVTTVAGQPGRWFVTPIKL